MDVPAQILPASAAVEDPDDSAYLTLEQAKRLSLMTCNDIDITDAYVTPALFVICFFLFFPLSPSSFFLPIQNSRMRVKSRG